MGVKIVDVVKRSLAHKAGLKSDYTLNKINGTEIFDVLDYDFYATDSMLEIEYTDSKGKTHTSKIKKDEYEDIGLVFSTYLIDKQRSCKNKCIFCFIDQLPKGMRDTLYFKDDDERLSFIFGNYITLTNITDREVYRIIKMHISPINISVHTTNPKLRCKMMNNRFAGQALDYIKKLAQAGIKLNCQLVLCPGINDGDELLRSLNDLSALYPQVQSIACVPVGISDHRDGLYPLSPYTSEQSAKVIDMIDEFSRKFENEHGKRIAYPADEFYINANRSIPQAEFYGEFNQLENGVGMLALLKSEFVNALSECEVTSHDKKISIVTGVAAKPYIQELVDMVKEKANIDCTVYAVKNDFFGHNITVSGLVTGKDIINQLKDYDLGDLLLIPENMLRSEKDMFLDDVTLTDLSEALSVKVEYVANDGYELLDKITNI